MATIAMRRRSGVLGAGIVAFALLTGCAGPDAAGPAGDWTEPGRAVIDIARQAPDVTRAAGSTRYEATTTDATSGDPLGDGTSTSSGTGTYDFDRQIGDGRYTFAGDQAWMQLPPMEMVFTNNMLYQREVGATRWQLLDFSALVNRPVGQHDPSQQLDLLRGVSDDIREVGSTRLRDTEVQQYAITIDPQRLAEQSGVVVDGGLVQAALQAAGPIPGQVYVDADGRVRRFEVTLETSGADLAASPEFQEMLGDSAAGVQERLQNWRTTSKLAVEYFEFGVPVTAQVPDSSAVDAGLSPLSGPALQIPGN